MPQQIKIEKRIAEELDGLRKMAAFLPPGKALALRNKCDRISRYASKAQALVDSPVGSLFPAHTANYDARTNDDMAKQAEARKAVFLALCGGRKISLLDAAEFHTSQMHTTITKIRRDIERKHPDLELCDEWVRLEGTRPFKSYWIVEKEVKS